MKTPDGGKLLVKLIPHARYPTYILSYLATTCIWPSYSETEEDFELPVGSFNAKFSET